MLGWFGCWGGCDAEKNESGPTGSDTAVRGAHVVITAPAGTCFKPMIVYPYVVFVCV